ncbi:protein peste-like [Toxorhynchites rutilus septentrionalis]|uniref:protein peste-like n=1 Tax=Toxorhynchites rutilus septentrionalis TaxID=329112 RepID=UPI0024788899|nr:protein peste-like [Toxorhynchites rutilus septentrionalis]
MKINKFYCAATLGALLASVGVIFALFWGDILDAIVIKEKYLTPTSKAFKLWKRPPFQLRWEITFFNWTNANDFLENKATKPSFAEVGPYFFTESPEKIDIRFNPKNASISFRRRSYFTPDDARSVASASPDEPITSINMVALSAANRARFWGYAAQRAVSFALYTYQQDIFVSRTARELLFDGYPEPMIKRAQEILSFIGEDIQFDGRFSWFHTINGSKKAYGHFNIDTGRDDPTRYGLIRAWNFKSRADFADGECGKFQGFSGDIFPTKIRKDRPLGIFTPEMCRMVSFEFEREEDVLGIKGYRFVGSERTIDNGSLYAENQCNFGGEFMPSGVINITECRLGAPFYMSFPHFHLADPFYRDQMEGMMPDKERHQFFFTIEPTTGLVLNASVRFQINVLLQKYPAIALYQDAPRSYIPVLWFSRSFEITQEEALKLRGLLKGTELGYFGGFAVAAVGLLVALVSLGLGCAIGSRKSKNTNDDERTVRNGDARGNYQAVQNGCKDKEVIKL